MNEPEIIEIKRDIEPHLDYVVDEIADMRLFDKARAKLLLLWRFATIIQNVMDNRSQEIAGQTTNNQRDIQYSGLGGREKHFLQNENQRLKEKLKEVNRIASFAKNVKEYIQLKQYLKQRFSAEEYQIILDEAMVFEPDLSGHKRGQRI